MKEKNEVSKKFQHSYKLENGNFPEQGNDTLAPAHALADTYQNRKRSFTKTRNTKINH